MLFVGTGPHLKGPLVCVCAHVHGEGGGVSKLFRAEVAYEAAWGVPLGQRRAAVCHHMLCQGSAGGEPLPAGCKRAAERRLARVREPVQVQAILCHAAVAAHIALELTPNSATPVTFIAAPLSRFPCAALHVHI